MASWFRSLLGLSGAGGDPPAPADVVAHVPGLT
jgi:hypothetical protein